MLQELPRVGILIVRDLLWRAFSYDATAGSVKIDDHDVRDVTLNSLRAQIAKVTP